MQALRSVTAFSNGLNQPPAMALRLGELRRSCSACRDENPASLWRWATLHRTKIAEGPGNEVVRMFEFLHRGRGRATKDADAGLSIAPDHAVQRHAARHYGAPDAYGICCATTLFRPAGCAANWCPSTFPGEGEALLQMEVMHWNDALVLHALALQNELSGRGCAASIRPATVPGILS